MKGNIIPVLLIVLIAYFGVGYGWNFNKRRLSERYSTLQEMILSSLDGSIIHASAYYAANRLEGVIPSVIMSGGIVKYEGSAGGYKSITKHLNLTIKRVYAPVFRGLVTALALIIVIILDTWIGIWEISGNVNVQLFLIIASVSVATGSVLHSVKKTSSEFASEKYGWLPKRPWYHFISLSIPPIIFLPVACFTTECWNLITNNLIKMIGILIIAFIFPFLIFIVDKGVSKSIGFNTIEVCTREINDSSSDQGNEESKLKVTYKEPVKDVRIYFESPDDVEIEYVDSENKEEYLTKENSECEIKLVSSGNKTPKKNATVDLIAKYFDPDSESVSRSIKIKSTTIEIS